MAILRILSTDSASLIIDNTSLNIGCECFITSSYNQVIQTLFQILKKLKSESFLFKTERHGCLCALVLKCMTKSPKLWYPHLGKSVGQWAFTEA